MKCIEFGGKHVTYRPPTTTTKFYNYSISTIFVLVVFSSEVVYENLKFNLNSFKPHYYSQDDFELRIGELQSFISSRNLKL
jgi:hypothetical protein